MSRVIVTTFLLSLGAGCSSEDVEHHGFAAWADDETAMAIVTERSVVSRQAFRTEGDVLGRWYRVWTRDVNDGRLRLILEERQGSARDVYFMRSSGYLLLDLEDHAILISTDGDDLRKLDAMDGERDFTPSRDGTMIASARLRDCVGRWPSECAASVVFRDAFRLEVIEDTDPQIITPATRDSVMWTRDGAAVLTDGRVAYEAVPGDGDARLPEIDVPCLWAPTSSFYVNSDGMFIDVAVQGEEPVITLEPTDDPVTSCPIP